jgi:rhodanese-related sulfurtransferase
MAAAVTWRQSLGRAFIEAAALFVAAVVLAAVVNAGRPGSLSWTGTGPFPPLTGEAGVSLEGAPEPAGTEMGLSTRQALELLEAGKAIFLDARTRGEFAAGHIPGALNIPPDMAPAEFERLLAGRPGDKALVAYCSSRQCAMADDLAINLELSGIRGVLVYPGGWDEWVAAKAPVEEGPGLKSPVWLEKPVGEGGRQSGQGERPVGEAQEGPSVQPGSGEAGR